MTARRLFDRLRIGGELVPEAIEVDPFATFDQPLRIRSAEIEMPEQGTLDDVLPVANARQRRVDYHPPRDPVRILGGESVADHVTDVVGYQIGLVDLEAIENASEVSGLVHLRITGLGMVREAHAPQVRHDYGLILGQPGRD